MLHVLYNLLEKDRKWKWTRDCEEAFKTVKRLIVSDEVLTHYDQNLPLCLASDASPYGFGAVLSHIMPNGDERPIAYASRSLSTSEKKLLADREGSVRDYLGSKTFQHLCLRTTFSAHC